jgi:hypothetical protein
MFVVVALQRACQLIIHCWFALGTKKANVSCFTVFMT